MLHLFPGLLGLWPWLPCSLGSLPGGPAGSGAHCLLFPLGPAMKTSVWGFFFSPPCSKFSGKYN